MLAGVTGYSGTPLARKLGIGPASSLALVDAPSGWAVPDLPEAVTFRSRAGGTADVVVVFCRSARDVRRRLPALGAMVWPSGGLWVAWPRKAGGHVSDVTEQLLRDVALPSGLVDTKVAALDDDWSGLRFTWRVGLRDGACPL